MVAVSWLAVIDVVILGTRPAPWVAPLRSDHSIVLNGGAAACLLCYRLRAMQPPANLDDNALVQRCLAGDDGAWRALVRRYQRLVYAVACRAGLDEHAAADVFQTVFVRLHEALHRIREPGRLHAWIVTTAKRETLLVRQRASRAVSLDALRDGAPGDDGPGWDPPADDPLPDALLSELQQLHRLRTAFDRLDERCRTLLLQLFADDDERVPYAEVAQRLGMPAGSLGPTRGRCLDKLRRLFGEAPP